MFCLWLLDLSSQGSQGPQGAPKDSQGLQGRLFPKKRQSSEGEAWKWKEGKMKTESYFSGISTGTPHLVFFCTVCPELDFSLIKKKRL